MAPSHPEEPAIVVMGSEFSVQNENVQPHPPPPMASLVAVAQLYLSTSPLIQLLERSGLLHLTLLSGWCWVSSHVTLAGVKGL